jgi:hypothetical protein
MRTRNWLTDPAAYVEGAYGGTCRMMSQKSPL